MLKKKLILAGIVLFMFGLTTSSFAQMKCAGHPSGRHKHNSSVPTTQTSQEKAVAVGNKVCPVLNEKIDERNKATYEYEGKIYNFCCAACIEDFKKDPQKYIKKVEEELKAASKAKENQRKMLMNREPESSGDEDVHRGHHRYH